MRRSVTVAELAVLRTEAKILEAEYRQAQAEQKRRRKFLQQLEAKYRSKHEAALRAVIEVSKIVESTYRSLRRVLNAEAVALGAKRKRATRKASARLFGEQAVKDAGDGSIKEKEVSSDV